MTYVSQKNTFLHVPQPTNLGLQLRLLYSSCDARSAKIYNLPEGPILEIYPNKGG